MTKSEYLAAADRLLDRLAPVHGSQTLQLLLEMFAGSATNRRMDIYDTIFFSWATARFVTEWSGRVMLGSLSPPNTGQSKRDLLILRMFVGSTRLRCLQIKDTLTIQETAQYMGYSDDHVRRLIRQGQIEATDGWPRRCMEESVTRFCAVRSYSYAYQERWS